MPDVEFQSGDVIFQDSDVIWTGLGTGTTVSALGTQHYGVGIYGQSLYGGLAYPYAVRIEHWRGTVLEQRLDTVLRDASWEYLRYGGCGQGTFTLALDFEQAMKFNPNDEIRVYSRDVAGPGLSRFYRGCVCHVEPQLGAKDSVTVSTMGYRIYLDRLTVDATYTNTEVSLIIRDILDTYVCPYSGITYNSAEIETTTFTPDSITFFCSAAEAIDLLAKLAGMQEYGVDRDGHFYFVEPSDTVGFRFLPGRDIVELRDYYDYEQICNRIIVRGADTVKRTRNSAESQARYGIRAKIIHNTAATTNAVADQYGDAVLADQAEIQTSGNLTLTANRQLIESAVPIPLLTRGKGRIKYGEVKYGYALYEAAREYVVSRISYRLSELGLTTSLELGGIRPKLADLIFQLNSNVRAARPT